MQSDSSLIADHQRAVLAKDLNNAVPIPTKFQCLLSRHIRFEETCLLPIYAQEGGETAGGTLAIFQAEHQKLEAITDKLLEKMVLYGARDLDAQVIAILDQEALFKRLFDHHAHRERNILLPNGFGGETPSDLNSLIDTSVERLGSIHRGPRIRASPLGHSFDSHLPTG